MNTSLLTPGTVQPHGHPPDTEDRQILTVPDAEQRQNLTPADRLRLAIGLWLLQRMLSQPQLSEQELREQAMLEQQRMHITTVQAFHMHTFDMQRHQL